VKVTMGKLEDQLQAELEAAGVDSGGALNTKHLIAESKTKIIERLHDLFNDAIDRYARVSWRTYEK
jgi:hypothetical protein